MGPLKNSISQATLQLTVAMRLGSPPKEGRRLGAMSPIPPPFAWNAAAKGTGVAASSSPGEESRAQEWRPGEHKIYSWM